MGTENTKNPLGVLEEVLQEGITCFQLREKGPHALIGDEKRAFAEKCQQLCRQYGVPFIVNDDVELALAIDADGVHIGQDDESAADVRKKMGAHKILGVSVHSIEEAIAAKEAGADYVGMGPIYPTISKSDAKPVAGTDKLQEVAALFPDLPIVGIGGITPENAAPVFRAGGAGVAAISIIASAESPKAVVRRFQDVIANEMQERGILR
ncbi:thiamine-phosphate pyrophosphorylase [Sporosarcina sp. HYO08]|nr:thiamine-phosphate pyrophosphorylase [Sporosarcina sp. HYO08]